jgi:hypothetical protein
MTLVLIKPKWHLLDAFFDKEKQKPFERYYCTECKSYCVVTLPHGGNIRHCLEDKDIRPVEERI